MFIECTHPCSPAFLFHALVIKQSCAGVHPAVASASLACMVLFTSATATISYATVGLLTYDYAAMCALIGFGATVAGQTVMRALMKQYQRNSYIAFAIGIVVGLSAICMTIESVVAIRADV
jgi:uncharacterized membrane protein YfcA